MKKNGSFIGLIALMIVTTILHGKWTGRWESSHAEKQTEKELENALSIETDLGDWKCGKVIQLSADELPEKTINSTRQFIDPHTDRSLVVSLTSGVASIVSVHTPDVCYLGNGFQLASEIKKEIIVIDENGIRKENQSNEGEVPLPSSDSSHQAYESKNRAQPIRFEFYVADFSKKTPTGKETLRVRWSWSYEGNWQAPDSPRWFFVRLPLGATQPLYKLYLVHNVTEEDRLTTNDPYLKIARLLLPQLNKRLFAGRLSKSTAKVHH